MKKLFFLVSLFLFTNILFAQEAKWLPGYIINKDGEKVEGQVRAWRSSGNNVVSLKFRKNEGDKAIVYKAADVLEINQDGFVISSMKIKKKFKFFKAIHKGEQISLYQDPKAKTVGMGNSLNEGQLLSFLVYKDGEFTKVSKLKFKKNMRKLCGDKEEWVKKSKDKKWFRFSNCKEVAKFYDSL